MYIPKTYNSVSFIALFVQFNAAHDFNKKQEISASDCLYVILKFSIYLLFPLKELFPLVNNKDNWYECYLYIHGMNQPRGQGSWEEEEGETNKHQRRQR